MENAIAWILKTLLRLLLPPSGRHRAAPHQHTSTTPRPARVPAPPGAPILSGLSDDAGPATVRPCVLTHAQRAKRAARRQRRRALWLAVHGIDIGPRVIHGVRVVA
ncbi:hypothetical protein [Streptomyces sp. NPDC097640]|uniref:hypothetical protein n=1 Tax=Streptomyces sp. NPDC097640 TaxID=3157229 RepID=UPI00331F6B33